MRLVLPLLLWCWLGAAFSATPLRIDQGEFLLAPDATLPPPSAIWQPQSLPDHWRSSRPGVGDAGWYRFQFIVDTSQPPSAIYLPRVIQNAALYLNGVAIGDGGRFEEPLARNWNRPLFFLLPAGLLRQGANTLHVRLKGHAYSQTTLEPFWIGTETQLRDEYDRAHFLRITLNQSASLLIGGIGLLVLGIWWWRRQETAYAYFAVSALIWALQSTNLYLRDIPVDTAAWEIFANGGFQTFSALLLISLLRFVGIHRPWLEKALWLSMFGSPIAQILTDAEHYFAVTAFWHFCTLTGAAITLALLVQSAWREKNHDARFLVGAMGIVVLFALHDWAIHSQHLWPIPIRWPLVDVFLLHYSAPMVFLAIGVIMTGRYIRVLNQFEALNLQLEDRIRAEQSKLQESYARMRQLEMARAVAEERERIYRDLHDDVGAKLLSLVYRAALPEDADLARSALSDLRDVVSRTGADTFALEELTADWRQECERRLSEAGLTLEWRSDIASHLLSQPQALNLGRILREAISNAIRHAQARRVRVSLVLDAARFCLEIEDDGTGFPQETTAKGRGLRNMAARAARLGGALERDSGELGGCRLRLTIPRSTLLSHEAGAAIPD